MAAAHVITWIRDTTYVQEISGAGRIHARCGVLEVGGHYWEGFERLGRVMLNAGNYPKTKVYKDPSRGPVILPWHDQMVPDKKDPKKLVRAEILFHQATVPSNLDGCVGVGFIFSDKLQWSAEAMWKIYALVGCSTRVPEITVALRVVGERTPFSTDSTKYLAGLTRYAG